jgi:hypothetical protein
VRASDTYLNGIQFDDVQVHLQDTSHYSAIDVSVAAPFLRRSKYVVTLNGEVKMRGDTRRSLTLPRISSLEEFEILKDKIWQMVYPRVVGREEPVCEDAQALHDWMLETKKTILETIARERVGKEEPVHELHQLLVDGREEEVLAIIRSSRSFVEPTPGELVEAAFAPLISITSRTDFSSSSYQTYPSTRLSRMPDSGPVDESDLWGNIDDTDELSMLTCEITGEEDVPVLLFKSLRACSQSGAGGLFSGLETSVINHLANQPLNTLRNQRALDLLVNSIDHVMGVQAYVQWTSHHGHKTSPFTRAPLAGALPISTNKNLIRYANKFICQFLWGGKKVGTPVMWPWVVYFAVRDHPKLGYLRTSYPQFLHSLERSLVYRTTTEVTRLGMSGLGTFPVELVPISVATWYCVRGSSVLYADKLLYRTQERLLQFRYARTL